MIWYENPWILGGIIGFALGWYACLLTNVFPMEDKLIKYKKCMNTTFRILKECQYKKVHVPKLEKKQIGE